MYIIYSTSKQGEVPVWALWALWDPLGRGQVVLFSYCSCNLGDGGQGVLQPAIWGMNIQKSQLLPEVQWPGWRIATSVTKNIKSRAENLDRFKGRKVCLHAAYTLLTPLGILMDCPFTGILADARLKQHFRDPGFGLRIDRPVI